MARKFWMFRYTKSSPTAAKTLFQFLVATNHRVVIERIDFMLKGSTGATQAPVFEFLLQDDAGTGGTAFASGALTERSPGYAGAIQLSGITNPGSGEPSVTTGNGRGHPMGGHQQSPFSWSPPQGPMYMESDERWGLFFVDGSTPDMVIHVYGEE